MRSGSTRRARPVESSVSSSRAQSVPSPEAGVRRSVGSLRVKRGDRRGLVHADHRIIVAAHTDVGLIARAAGQDHDVRRRHVGMGADAEADLAIEEVAHGHLLACRLAVKIDHDDVGGLAQTVLGQHALDRGEGVVQADP